MDLAESRDGYSGLYAVIPDCSGHFLCVGFSGLLSCCVTPRSRFSRQCRSL